MNNKELNDLIEKAIDTLINAKQDIVNRKNLIIEATNYIKEAIDKLKGEEPILNIDLLDLVKYNISNNNTNGIETTKGINQLLLDVKEQGYNRVKLPPGTYAIDSSVTNPIELSDNVTDWKWTHPRKGVAMPSDLE